MARLPLLENLPLPKRAPHQSYQLGPLLRIDDNLLDNRQKTYREQLVENIEALLTLGLKARPLQNRLDQLIAQPAPTNLTRAIEVARAIVLQQALPVWLGMASPTDQALHAELVEQSRLSAPEDRDYLHGIPALRELATQRLSELLKARYPDLTLNPNDILIPLRPSLQGAVQTLIDFAVKHQPNLHGENIQPRSRTSVPLPATLNASAVIQLVQQVGLQSLYQAWIAEHLAHDTNSLERRRLFCRQLPWQLLRYAHEEHLEERLSASAWGFIQQVFDMPDSVARLAVSGATAVIRPLELLANPRATKVQAPGMYLIGARPPGSGPLVLYAPYCPGNTLREFQREEDVIREISTPGLLHDWLLQRLEAPHQAVYRNLLQAQHHPSASEVRLASSPITGNILTRLFKDNTQLLTTMLASQFDRSGQEQWQGFTQLSRGGVLAALQFLQGKLMYPLVVWRSYKLFKASAEHLQQQRFGEGLKAFISGVAQLASLRRSLEPAPAPPAPLSAERALEWEDQSAPSATALLDIDLTEPTRTRLQALENHEIELSQLDWEPRTHLHKNATTGQWFTALAGKVYPVRKAGEHWQLANQDRQGPYISRDTRGQWALDLNLYHPRYGKTLSRYGGRIQTRRGEREAINIEAAGMRDAALSSWKAQAINEALNVATYYAVNCKRNIIHFAAQRNPGSRVGRFFTELFGVITLNPDQVRRVEAQIDGVLNELVNHTLTSPDSRRFVCGTSRYNAEGTFAFTLPDDIEQKIYLLDRFFDPQMDVYQNRLNTPFDIPAHARATVLIHELSHLKCFTEDIAYMDSMRPFSDLINLRIRGAPVLKTELDNLRDMALSVLTPATILFKSWDVFSAT